MGCRSSSQGQEGQDSYSIDESGAPMSVKSEHHYPVEILKILASKSGVSPEQKEFLDAWCRLVYERAQSRLGPGDTSLSLCTDLAYLEISITSDWNFMDDLAWKFVTECGIEDHQILIQMGKVMAEAQLASMTLWCRLKRIGTSSPGVDVGFSIAANLEWVVADLLMPPTRDQELFRAHAAEELLKPCMFRSSIFPVEPESALGIEIKGPPRKTLLTALFFFRTLGFTKPEDATVQILSDCPANSHTINIFMGPKGLTRLMLRIHGPRRAVAEDLSGTCMGCKYNDQVLRLAGELIGYTPDFVDYVADARGYTVGVGFSTFADTDNLNA